MTEEDHRKFVADATRSWPTTDNWETYFNDWRKQMRNEIRKGHGQIVEALATVYKRDREKMSRQVETHLAALASEIREQRDLTRRRLDEGLLEYRSELLALREANVTLKAEIEELRSLQHPRLVSGR